MDHLKLSDPEVFEAIVAEEHRQRDELELIASENYTSAAVMEAVGSVLTNKYAEGLPGQALLRRLPARRHDRAARDRAGEAALRRRARQRPAALGGHGEPGRLLRGARDRRHRPGDGPGPGRPPDARDEAELLGPLVSDDRLRRRPEDRADRLSTASPQLAREHKPKLILAGASAYPRIIDFDRIGRDRPRGRRDLLRRHGPHRGPRRGRRAPEPGPHRRLRDDDHAQDPPRPSRGDRDLQGVVGARSSTRPSSRASRAARWST